MLQTLLFFFLPRRMSSVLNVTKCTGSISHLLASDASSEPPHSSLSEQDWICQVGVISSCMDTNKTETWKCTHALLWVFPKTRRMGLKFSLKGLCGACAICSWTSTILLGEVLHLTQAHAHFILLMFTPFSKAHEHFSELFSASSSLSFQCSP